MSDFAWYELMTPDVTAAVAFYGAVTGWTGQAFGPDYTVLSVGSAGVGGVMALSPEMAAAGAKPGWLGYIGVEDVDAAAAKLRQAGGAVHRPPGDIPNVGRFAVVADPQGAVFMLFKGLPAEPPPRPAPGTPGTIGWHELHAADGDTALAFYAGMFGWAKTETMDMGPMGSYHLFAAGAAPIGGVMTKTEAELPPYWLFYFAVENIDAAIARVAAQGGTVVNGPHQVPGGSWIIVGIDPQGVRFALVGPRA
jgi:predicted enzyme related to lactoylglutathione lyase